MKILKKYLIFLLCFPLLFACVSCKKKETNNSTKKQQDNPTPVITEKFSVNFDFNLPEKYSYLLNNETYSNINVGSIVDFPNIADNNLKKQFLGWCLEGSEDVLNGSSITSSQAKTINLKGKWKDNGIENYYYTPGISFELDSTKAYVNSYSGPTEKIIIPKYYSYQDTDYIVSGVNSSVFESSNVSEILLNATNFEVKSSAFKNSKLSSIEFNNITKIGDNAFEGTKFINVTLSSSTTQLSNYAFANCVKLTTFNFNEANVSVSQNLFKGCSLLSSVTLSSKSSYIDESAFENCIGLKNVNFIGSKISLINENAFKNCTEIVSAIIPKSVTFIGSDIFAGCGKLSNLTVARYYFGDTFSSSYGLDENSLKNITLTDDIITSISKDYFDDLVNLETFVMCNSITTVADYSFSQCSKLGSITLSTALNVNNITKNAFSGTKFLSDLAEPLVISNVIIYVPSTIAADYTIPTGVVKINESAFAGNSALTKITIPSTVQVIGNSAFSSCSNLVNVVFDENSNITSIGENVFYDCKKLSTINLGNLTALTTIENNSFSGVNVVNFVIPSTVTNISSTAFFDANISSFEISGTADKYQCVSGILYYISGSVKKLVSYPKMKSGEFFEIPSDVTDIASYAFAYTKNLKYVYFVHSSLSWESVLIKGENKYRAFYGTYNSIIVFIENPLLNVKGTQVEKYYLISSNYSYDSTNDEITFTGTFDISKEKYFIVVDGSVQDKDAIVFFKLSEVESEIAIVEDTQTKLDNVK